MAFRREVQNRGRLMLLQQHPNQAAIPYIPVHKFVTAIRRDCLKITQVSSVGKFVEIDERSRRVRFQLLQDEVRPDKPRPASDQDDISHESLIVIKTDGNEKGRA